MTKDVTTSLRELADRLDAHMGHADMDAVLADCRSAAKAITGLLDEIEELRDFKRSVAEQISEEAGHWHTCSGCYESEDGYPNGHYPFSDVFQCTLGGGCRECGGIGAVWNNTDYSQLAEDMAAEYEAEMDAEARALSAEGEVQTLKDHIVALLAARERELKADEAVELLKERGCTRTELERAVHVTLEAMAHASAVEALARLSIGKGNGEGLPEGKQPPQSGPGAVAPATFGQVTK